jgi:dihydrofolate reductase
MIADEDLHRHAVENLDQAEALLVGRVRESGKGLFVGGVKLPLALAELGLIDEFEFVVHPRLAGHGPMLFAGLSKQVDLRLVSRLEFGSGAVAMRYEASR